MALRLDMLYGSPPSGDRFTDRRRTGVGGSDAAAIIGVSPYQSALGLWERKRGIVTDERPPTERMIWGTRLERAILDGYAEDHGRKVRSSGRVFRRHPVHEFVVGHPDGETEDERLIEVKTTAMLDDRWGPDGSDEIPAHYFAQVQHYLILTGYAVADVAALVGGRELHVYTVEADRAFAEALLDAEHAFWQGVVNDVPPEPDGSDDAAAALRRMFPRSTPEEIVATPEMADAADEFLAARTARDMQQSIMDVNAQRIQRFMGARSRMIGPGFTATWSDRSGVPRWKEIAARYRDLLVPYHDDAALDEIALRERTDVTRGFTVTKKRSTP